MYVYSILSSFACSCVSSAAADRNYVQIWIETNILNIRIQMFIIEIVAKWTP